MEMITIAILSLVAGFLIIGCVSPHSEEGGKPMTYTGTARDWSSVALVDDAAISVTRMVLIDAAIQSMSLVCLVSVD